MLDLLLINGEYPDFNSNSMRRANIGIREGLIDYIGEGEPESLSAIDVNGDTISPGFIDIHMHEENFKDEGDKYCIAYMMLNMGVTTAVGGNCGIQHQDLSVFKGTISKLNGAPINYMMLAGYNQCRYKLEVGRYNEATKYERAMIRDIIQKELSEGACGISFGIEYDPGMTTEEILYGIGASNDENVLVAAHYRGDCKKSISAITEMIEIADNIPEKFQISHLSSCTAMGYMENSLNMIHGAMGINNRLDYDTYPYDAFSTTIGSSVFEDGCFENWNKDYSDILLTEKPYKNVRCNEKIFKEVREKYPDMLVVAFVMNEDEISAAVADKSGCIASDAIINNGIGHPRAAGTFPRVLGKYVREGRAIRLVDALRKMTLKPALRLGLINRGKISIGCIADLTIFDKKTIIDNSTYNEPTLNPSGIKYVIINGHVALEEGKIVNEKLGRFLNYNDLS